MNQRTVQWLVLIPVGLFAFFGNLHLALFEGSEGLYAQVTREMVHARQFTSLTYQGEPYANKSPLFFWTLALSTGLFGEHEVALRLPGALFGFGTMVLTYALGKALFSRTAAFWPALVVPTTHVFLWYGRRVLFDSMLTFFITLALLAWVRAHIQKSASGWYVLAFLSMAVAAMTKGLHGFLLPLAVIALFLVMTRDAAPLKHPGVWVGLGLSMALLIGYSFSLDVELRKHFNPVKGIQSAFEFFNTERSPAGHPVYWYLLMMWFDFFPWCVLVPSSLLLLIGKRPAAAHQADSFVLAWVAGMFAVLSLATLKREPYVMPLVPGLGLMIGSYRRAMEDASERDRGSTALLRLLLVVLAAVVCAAVVVGPSLLHPRWNIEPSLFPAAYIVSMLTLAVALIYSVARFRLRSAFHVTGVLAVGFAFGMVQFILPAIDQAGSAKRISQDIKLLAETSDPSLHLYTPQWPKNEDAVYYLNLPPSLPRLSSERELIDLVRERGQVSAVMDKPVFDQLRQRKDLIIEQTGEFHQPRNKSLYLLMIRTHTADPIETSERRSVTHAR
ncbi:MAG: glycosyltransferase family 39 protein [Nitrospiraceae bacterium]|nr:glycosyltransferase family 39 protein [Nitrospiraceae bacterium]